jgi:hypothetical protein
MKSSYSWFSRMVQPVFLLGFILLAGCTDLLQGPPEAPDPAGTGDGRVLITLGSGTERTAFPLLDQFSMIVLSFQWKDGAGTMSPVEVSLGETLISLSPGTWEVTASAYNNAEPPVVAARAVNTLTRTGDLITGNTHFALAPVGTGPGILRYTITPPPGIFFDAAQSRVWIEKDGAVLTTLSGDGFSGGVRPINGAVAGGTVSLEPGRYVVDITLDDNASIKTAVYRDAVVILPGLVTEIVFAPEAGDFLDPNARAALTGTTGVSFGKTINNSSATVIGTAGGGEVNKTQTLSVHNGTETAYFTLSKAANQSVAIGGAAAGNVVMAVTGAVDGKPTDNRLAVFTVDTADIADMGGNREFTLSLSETGKTPIVYTVTLAVASLTHLHAAAWPAKWVYLTGESFDLTGLELIGLFTDGQHQAVTGGYTVEGFDTAAPGDKYIQIKKQGVTAKVYQTSNGEIIIEDWASPGAEGFTINVVSGMRLAFEPEIVAEQGGQLPGSSAITIKPPPGAYNVGPGGAVVLAPVKWYIPDSAVYEWKVDGVIQASTTEHLSFAYSSFGMGNHTVTVTAKLGGAPVASASTTVTCAAGASQRAASAGSSVTAAKLYSVVAPGQFGSTSGRLGRYHGAGGFGGYSVFKFDHSVLKNGTDGKEIKLGGNAGPWQEPGIIWVSRDENNNGEPDDTWYEFKGSHTLDPKTRRRYAVTFRSDRTWTDNLGNGGTCVRLQGWPKGSDTSPLTLVGTCLDDSTLGTIGLWGYADVWHDGRLSLSDVIQADGTSFDLPFIDFIKVVTAVHYADDLFGERSTEAETPTDLSMNNPEMLVYGNGPNGSGEYSYTFTNNSGYGLMVSFDGAEFTVAASGGMITKSSTKPSVYIDFYGGNVEMTKSNGAVTFTDGPSS